MPLKGGEWRQASLQCLAGAIAVGEFEPLDGEVEQKQATTHRWKEVLRHWSQKLIRLLRSGSHTPPLAELVIHRKLEKGTEQLPVENLSERTAEALIRTPKRRSINI